MKKVETQFVPNLVADYKARKAGYEAGYEDGYAKGVTEGGRLAYRSIYGAILVKLHDMHGFGKGRLHKLLGEVDQRILESLEHQELIDEAWEKTGLQLNFDAPFDRIEDTSE